MNRFEVDILHRCAERLRELPFVDKVDLIAEPTRGNARADGLLRITTPGATEDFVVEAKRTHLTRTIVDGVLAQAARFGPRPWILFAPHVGRPLARYLDEHGVNFVDLAGNCRLQVGRKHVAKIEGRPPEHRARQGRGVGAPGLQVQFALLVQPPLLNGTVRAVAKAAGVGTATAADRLALLRKEGLVHATDHKRRLTEPRKLLDMWLKGYETLVRPRLLIGRFRTKDTDPEALEHAVEAALGSKTLWGFGGAAAAHRLTGYYRGPDTIVHLEPPGFDVAKALRALPEDDGPLILLRAPGPIAFEGVKPHTVAPLLVYTELLVAGDRRAREASAEIQRKYMQELS